MNRLTVELPDGKEAKRDIVRHPGAVAIVALTDDGKICLVRQYRTSVGRVTVEIPAGKLDNASSEWDDDCAVSVVLASKGYPGKYNTGKVITGIDVAEAEDGITVYHAGTKLSDSGDILTAGGRVLDVTAVAPTFEEARERAYKAVELIDFEGKEFRTDIGAKAMR